MIFASFAAARRFFRLHPQPAVGALKEVREELSGWTDTLAAAATAK